MSEPTTSPGDTRSPLEQPQLPRRFGLLPATALNMTNMIGVGPFITIPLLMTALGGPQAMVGWIVALVIVICDGMVWSELGAAMPGSGGSFHYLREAFGRTRFGPLMAFLFVWQFILSGPLEIASGYIGFAAYAGYIWKGLTRTESIALIVGVGAVNVAMLYRRIGSIVTVTVSLWLGTLVTVLAVIVTGAMHFDPRIAFDFPPGAFNFSLGFFLGLGGIRGEALAQFASLGLTSQGCNHECMGRDARRGRQPDDAFLKVFWQLQARGGHSDHAF